MPPVWQILQTVAANGDNPPVLQQNGKLFAPVLFAPKVDVSGNDLWTHHLATVDCEVRWHLGLIHILTDQQATNIDTGVVGHGVHLNTNGCCAIICSLYQNCTQ
jgi:hypothetical protein